MKHAHTLTAVLVVSGALCSQQGSPAPTTDWAKEVDKACTSPRYGLRLAASKKVAAAGDAAVPAVRAFAKEKGKDAVPVALVEAYADGGGNSDAVLALLEEWSKDREFFWRAQALKGLAVRSSDAAIAARFADQFYGSTRDPAWLVRVYARLGAKRALQRDQRPEYTQVQWVPAPETDPRATTKLAAFQQQQGEPFRAQDLLDALGDERTFLGVDNAWGRRRAQEAFAALQAWLGDGCGYRVDATFADNQAAIQKLTELAAAKSGAKLTAPAHLADPATPFAGGLEVLSCRNGDLFVRWTADGALFEGLDATPAGTIPAATWQRLSASAAALRLDAQSGVVICDKLRLQLGHDGGHGVAAPGALPPGAADWLKQLGAAIEEAGARPLATALADRLQQFVAR